MQDTKQLNTHYNTKDNPLDLLNFTYKKFNQINYNHPYVIVVTIFIHKIYLKAKKEKKNMKNSSKICINM